MRKYKSAILEIIKSSNKHLTADEVYLLMKKIFPKIVLATIYNNLNSLVAEQKINRVKVFEMNYHYDNNLQRHGHLVCDICGSIEDIDINSFIGAIENNYLTSVKVCDINILHTCKKCNNTEKH